ncbi:DUF429 domain-containing protein [Sphingomonadaceae bacterium OTU29THOMA1]|nr:DUF429 domain-containing protein [Sphingomonadaceae bacterium OTU29THOMA1]
MKATTDIFEPMRVLTRRRTDPKREAATAAEGHRNEPAARAHQRPRTSRDMTPLLQHPDRVLFLDIETTGLSRHYDYITAVGFEIDGRYDVWLTGDDPLAFRTALARARSLITFNGTLFDLPFLDEALDGLEWPAHHVDLRYACRRVGLTGGQKRIEEHLGIRCREGMEGVDGAMAVLLWHRHLRGDGSALKSLVHYNRADVRAMTHILDHVIETLSPADLLSGVERPSFALRSVPGNLPARVDARASAPHSTRPGATFRSLFGGTRSAEATIVGLDLTGAAKRRTGVCVLRGDQAQTAALATDDEIVAHVLAAEPDLVSIDSPLCLPVGRTSAFDDDPERRFGIMRVCERILKRRGINVYPCLLPSMQRLTARGIALAARFRGHGLPVIECYPGAAQDIMGIPRKGAGQEWLQLGLSEFGVCGTFETTRVSHDELDAITCAIVGSFHLAGMTEGLAGPGEEPMVVPMLAGGQIRVVGISGETMAGKTTAARLLERAGFAYTRISLVIDEVIRERGGIPDRTSRQEVGLELHENPGQRWLCRKAIERVPADVRAVVVDGLRWREDADYLRERFGGGFVHLHVLADDAVRLDRARRLGRGEELLTASRHPVESEVAALAGVADCVLVNDNGQQSLEAHLAPFTRAVA